MSNDEKGIGSTSTEPMGIYNSTDTLPSKEFELQLLQFASDEKALLFLPVIVFMAILMVIGVLGNALVVYIYCLRFPNRSSNCFFITMALFDLLASAIGIPIDIYDVRNQYTFNDSVVCKGFQYVKNVTTYGSAIILVEIAFDRYLKICRPLEFGYMSRCRIMCIIALVIAITTSFPSLFLFGTTQENTTVKGINITGHDCSVAEEYNGGIFQKVFYGIQILIFVVTFSLIAGFYIRIWIEIKRRRGITIGNPIARTIDGVKVVQPILKRQHSFPSESEEDSSVFTNRTTGLYSKPYTFRQTSRSLSRQSKLTSISEAVSRMKVSRTTKIFIAVTLVFVLSYLPSIAVMMSRTFIKRLRKSATVEEELFLKLFSRFHYLNNAVNPIIYSFLNINFRRQCAKVFKSVVFCCRSSWSKKKLSCSSKSPSGKRRFPNFKSNSPKSDRTHNIEMHSFDG